MKFYLEALYYMLTSGFFLYFLQLFLEQFSITRLCESVDCRYQCLASDFDRVLSQNFNQGVFTFDPDRNVFTYYGYFSPLELLQNFQDFMGHVPWVKDGTCERAVC